MLTLDTPWSEFKTVGLENYLKKLNRNWATCGAWQKADSVATQTAQGAIQELIDRNDRYALSIVYWIAMVMWDEMDLPLRDLVCKGCEKRPYLANKLYLGRDGLTPKQEFDLVHAAKSRTGFISREEAQRRGLKVLKAQDVRDKING